MFEDRRSKRVLVVSHCILNQNAKIDGCAHYPGAIREVAEAILDSGCGLIQLECPELMHLGLDRQVDPDAPRTIESEDTRVAEVMNTPTGRKCCRAVAQRLVHQIRQYLATGFSVPGVLGVNGSPTCGVETGWSHGRETIGPGVLMQELQEALARCGLPWPPMRGIKAQYPLEAVEALREILSGAGAARKGSQPPRSRIGEVHSDDHR